MTMVNLNYSKILSVEIMLLKSLLKRQKIDLQVFACQLMLLMMI